MLSNTATPKYYGEFREKVLSGKIPVNEYVSLQMQRIDRRTEAPRYYYDEQAVEAYILFAETELTLTDGSPLVLTDAFKLWAEDVYGWYEFVDKLVYVRGSNGAKGQYVKKRVKKRLTRKQFLIVARGAAKTMYLESIQGFHLVSDPETTDQITTSPTMRQSDEVLGPLRTAIARAPGSVFKVLTMGSNQNTTGNPDSRRKLYSSKAGIVNTLTNSILRILPMTIDRLQGLRCKIATVDEWLSCDIREDPIGAIEQGASKLPDYLIVAASSEGTVRNGPGDTIKMELLDILRGKYSAEHVSIWYYCLDDVKEVEDPEMWLKANPNLGITVSYEVYQEDKERAENAPASRNDILAKRFGIPMEGYTYFFTFDEITPHRKRNFWQMSCALGADLSQGDDFCAFTFLFPLGRGEFGVKTRSYITTRTFSRLPSAPRELYQKFIDEGSLIVLEGSVLDMMEVYDDLDQYIDENEYDVSCLGYDPYNAKEFVQKWAEQHGEYFIEKVPQGVKTESVPLGEIKDMATDRKLIFDQELMKFAMGNCVVLEDTNGNRKLLKKRYEEKIDNVAALLDAWVAYKVYKDQFF
mgnify:CR=1 FL=1